MTMLEEAKCEGFTETLHNTLENFLYVNIISNQNFLKILVPSYPVFSCKHFFHTNDFFK